ncbi:hypothetical protein BSL78_17864 [Apostichopus japonicus]|uniref:Reverse transcriptase n=1 Tax=Stichopus japonicus TaxID=307972 RepID=A0A2G8KB88_STIJA|nr:hypothetical protein BSL78_17864 [Apostichopus japonicus]
MPQLPVVLEGKLNNEVVPNDRERRQIIQSLFDYMAAFTSYPLPHQYLEAVECLLKTNYGDFSMNIINHHFASNSFSNARNWKSKTVQLIAICVQIVPISAFDFRGIQAMRHTVTFGPGISIHGPLRWGAEVIPSITFDVFIYRDFLLIQEYWRLKLMDKFRNERKHMPVQKKKSRPGMNQVAPQSKTDQIDDLTSLGKASDLDHRISSTNAAKVEVYILVLPGMANLAKLYILCLCIEVQCLQCILAGCHNKESKDQHPFMISLDETRFVLPSIFPIGRGLWKLNCRILGEAEFRQGFETRYKGWQTLKPAFASTSQWWDDVKLRIKRYAIQYCVTRARRRREKFSKLCAEVKFGDPSAVIALQTYLDEKYHGARVRARVEAVEAEERPSLRFYQSVSSSAGDRRVPSVRATDGTVVSDPHGIVRADLLRGISKTVPHDVNDILGGGITTVELWKALSKMKNGKSPGSDGLPREFYRTFWAIIGPDIRAVFEDAFQNGLLNQSQRLGMITLLPKSGDPLDPLTSVRSPC